MSNFKSSKEFLSFSFISYFFPSKQVRMFYKAGMKHLNEYLDITKIIKRLQDLDKLKMILLNDNQRRLIELMPKPRFWIKLMCLLLTMSSNIIPKSRVWKRLPKNSIKIRKIRSLKKYWSLFHPKWNLICMEIIMSLKVSDLFIKKYLTF